MSANSGSLAIAELSGAAAFITTVVLGVITLVQPFSVDPRTFVGDIVWFLVAASLLIAFLADGSLVMGECLAVLTLYVAFALFAIFRPRAEQRLMETLDTPDTSLRDSNDDQHRPDAVHEDAQRLLDSLDAHQDSIDSHTHIFPVDGRTQLLQDYGSSRLRADSSSDHGALMNAAPSQDLLIQHRSPTMRKCTRMKFHLQSALDNPIFNSSSLQCSPGINRPRPRRR